MVDRRGPDRLGGSLGGRDDARATVHVGRRGRLQRIVTTVVLTTEEGDPIHRRVDLRFTWAEEVEVPLPEPALVDATPDVDEEAMAELPGGPVLFPEGLHVISGQLFPQDDDEEACASTVTDVRFGDDTVEAVVYLIARDLEDLRTVIRSLRPLEVAAA